MTQHRVARRLLMSVDAKGYGAADGRRQAGMQDGLVAVLGDSAAAARLDRSKWIRQPGGDGELAILPPDAPENVLVDDYVRELAQHLADYNADRVPAAQLRLRLAIHHGVAVPAANGYAGAGVVAVSRLVGCQPARAAQHAAPSAWLVVLISNRMYLDTVAQGHTALNRRQLRKVAVREKEYHDNAWLFLPGHDVHNLDLAASAAPAQATPAPAAPASDDSAGAEQPVRVDRRRYRAEVVNEFNSPVTATVIGVDRRRGNG